MNKEEVLELTQEVLEAWNKQDVEAVVHCYTPDCTYWDPNTRGPVVGRDAFRKYLSRLFEQWQMHWSLREFFPFREGDGGAFLWHAELTPASGGKTLEVDGMDLVVLQGEQLSRNEVYFDRMVLFS